MTGLSLWGSVVAVGLVCIFYTTLVSFATVAFKISEFVYRKEVFQTYICKILVNYATLKLTVFFIGRDESCRLDRFVSDVGHVRGNACFADFRKSEARRPRCGVGHC